MCVGHLIVSISEHLHQGPMSLENFVLHRREFNTLLIHIIINKSDKIKL
jgi:hypothetical protein